MHSIHARNRQTDRQIDRRTDGRTDRQTDVTVISIAERLCVTLDNNDERRTFKKIKFRRLQRSLSLHLAFRN